MQQPPHPLLGSTERNTAQQAGTHLPVCPARENLRAVVPSPPPGPALRAAARVTTVRPATQPAKRLGGWGYHTSTTAEYVRAYEGNGRTRADRADGSSQPGQSAPRARRSRARVAPRPPAGRPPAWFFASAAAVAAPARSRVLLSLHGLAGTDGTRASRPAT
jgi:hypothetical protein